MYYADSYISAMPPPDNYAPQLHVTHGYPLQSPTVYPLAQPVYPASTTQTSNTAVVIQQPQTQLAVQGPQIWSTELFDCFDDSTLCFIGVFCPMLLGSHVAKKAGECSFVGNWFPVALRASIRERYNIEGSIFLDACAIYLCPLCAFCQMGREVDIRSGR